MLSHASLGAVPPPESGYLLMFFPNKITREPVFLALLWFRLAALLAVKNREESKMCPSFPRDRGGLKKSRVPPGEGWRLYGLRKEQAEV